MLQKVLAGVGVIGGEGGFYKKESSPPYVQRLPAKSNFEKTSPCGEAFCYFENLLA